MTCGNHIVADALVVELEQRFVIHQNIAATSFVSSSSTWPVVSVFTKMRDASASHLPPARGEKEFGRTPGSMWVWLPLRQHQSAPRPVAVSVAVPRPRPFPCGSL
ncbi:hypothetical protein ACNKHM_27905 [Shigella sonnei]